MKEKSPRVRPNFAAAANAEHLNCTTLTRYIHNHSEQRNLQDGGISRSASYDQKLCEFTTASTAAVFNRCSSLHPSQQLQSRILERLRRAVPPLAKLHTYQSHRKSHRSSQPDNICTLLPHTNLATPALGRCRTTERKFATRFVLTINYNKSTSRYKR